MYQFKSPEDTIAAISTPIGQGGIGIVRVSGKNALSIVETVFRSNNKSKISSFKNASVHYGWIVDNDEVIDEVLVTIMRAPKSYTKEDVVEISCHGSSVSLKSILSLVCESGARLAEPGEFTKRAFLNGRIDLTQAEAVLDVINSKTETFLRVSNNQLKGELSTELEDIREELLGIYTEIEAVVNFPEDEIDADGQKELSKKISMTKARVDKLLQTSEHGKILKEGIKIVLCGKPNVGKSSLLNILLKTPRAIVSNIAGTTRDTIEETAQIKGIPFQLVDTAGILEPRDLIEEEAIKRSRMCIESSDLILLILDASEEITQEDQELIKNVKSQNLIVVINKCDLKSKIDKQKLMKEFKEDKIVNISATKKEGIERLEAKIIENIWHADNVDTHGVLVSNVRHVNALKECRTTLQKALDEINEGLSFEFISEEIKSAVNYLDSITGRNINEDLLDTIFSQFCIGK